MECNNKHETDAVVTAHHMTDLGIINAWKEIPFIFIECAKLGHVKVSKKLGRCYHEYTCEICKFTYSVDSSD